MTIFALTWAQTRSEQAGTSGHLSRTTLGWTLCLVSLLLPSSHAQAGLAASDVVVVVNGNSLNSRTLANHYVSLRNIPAANVIVLENVPNSEVVDVETFREQILKPLLAEVERRQLSTHIQCVTYSADFPTAIDIREELKPLGDLPAFYTGRASINALTFLYSRVLALDASTYANLEINFYARRPIEGYFSNPVSGPSQVDWQTAQELIADGKHAEASDILESLFKSHPEQFPLAYLAAAEAALAGNSPRSIGLLQAAIGAGWNAGGYMAKDTRFDSLRDEADFQILEFSVDSATHQLQPSIGFDARAAWTPNGIPVKDPKLGLRYLLSTVLGVTRGGGTTLAEAIQALQRSAAADATHPQGGFYFCLTKDVRTTTRSPGFEQAVADLQAMGFEAEIVDTTLPMKKPAVLGVQLGAPAFDWPSCRSQFVPGAIAENLTSLGGVMTNPSPQTRLTELIKAGAAGSSGTVIEPYSMQQKFPNPQLYVHYARGASLAEAFYLSVTGPYQLLIVGDPLCQPFSNAPQPNIPTELQFLDEGSVLQVNPDLSAANFLDWNDSEVPRAKRTNRLAPLAVGVLFDNKSPQGGIIKPKIDIPLKGQTPGYHEFCLRFVADDPLAQRSDTIIPVWIGQRDQVRLLFPNQQQSRQVSLKSGKLAVRVESQPAAEATVERLSLWHDMEQIAVASGTQAEFDIALDSLGMGPVRLQAKAELADGSIIAGIPVTLQVAP